VKHLSSGVWEDINGESVSSGERKRKQKAIVYNRPALYFIKTYESV